VTIRPAGSTVSAYSTLHVCQCVSYDPAARLSSAEDTRA
jgi:hypothetical protein